LNVQIESKNAPLPTSSSKEGFLISRLVHHTSFLTSFSGFSAYTTANTKHRRGGENRRRKRRGGKEGRRKRRRQGGDEDGSKGISHHLRTVEEKWLKTVQNNTDSSPKTDGKQPK
jgi:hypothetical protein